MKYINKVDKENECCFRMFKKSYVAYVLTILKFKSFNKNEKRENK